MILFCRVIDCTGDADIAHMAGAEYRKTGDKEKMTGGTPEVRSDKSLTFGPVD